MRVKPYAIRQHLELGGGDVLQRMEMAQPSVANHRIASHRTGPGVSAAAWMS